MKMKKLQNAKCKLQIEQFRSGDHPCSLLRAPRNSGISLTEVLIAMGIMTVGLLGVASVFPVGSWYMQKAEVTDHASAIAQSAMNGIVTQGLLNPFSWFMMTPQGAPAQNPTTSNPNSTFAGIDGKYVPQIPANAVPAPIVLTFTRPFGEALLAAQKSANSTPATSLTREAIISKQIGDAFVIDPLGVAAGAQPKLGGAVANNTASYAFPASAVFYYPSSSPGYYVTNEWAPWKPSAANPKQYIWPIRRVTFREPSTGYHLSRSMAELYFSGSDDLAYDFPQRADRPAMQKLESSSGTALARKFTGDYSWIVTVAPSTADARDGMATNPEGYEYNVSVVVFYKRQLPASYPQTPPDMSINAASERSFGASVLSTSPSGGELLIRDISGETNVFQNLKAGEWIMLCGPHPASTTTVPRFVMNWYQVLNIDSSGKALGNGSDFDTAKYRVVSVRGPEWPWQPQANASWTDYTTPRTLSNDLCVGVFKGAVAVHSKTMRLQDFRDGKAFGTSGDPAANLNDRWF
jgi:type II secretory pathway pseudopilin PulG